MGLSYSEQTNVGALFAGVLALTFGTATAGGAGDGTAREGTAIDLTAFPRRRPGSCKVQVLASATLAATKTAILTLKVQHAPAGSSTWADYTYRPDGTAQAAVTLTLTGGGGGTTETGLLELDVDLAGCDDQFRVHLTPELNATATDVCTTAAIVNFGGGMIPMEA